MVESAINWLIARVSHRHRNLFLHRVLRLRYELANTRRRRFGHEVLDGCYIASAL
jgi:hypothetical protein